MSSLFLYACNGDIGMLFLERGNALSMLDRGVDHWIIWLLDPMSKSSLQTISLEIYCCNDRSRDHLRATSPSSVKFDVPYGNVGKGMEHHP